MTGMRERLSIRWLGMVYSPGIVHSLEIVHWLGIERIL